MLKTKENIIEKSAAGGMVFRELDAEGAEDYLSMSRRCPYLLSCYSAGFMIMWRDYFNASHAEAGGCAVVRLKIKGKEQFLYPFAFREGANLDAALAAIEKYAAKNSIPLSFYAVPRSELPRLASRYTNFSFSVNRNDSDYIYSAGDLRDFPGRKYAGQRNHINKFTRLYPGAFFRPLGADGSDLGKLERFWERYEAGFVSTLPLAALELKRAKEMLSSPASSAGRRGCVELDGEIISVSCGEICGDALIVHIEKALEEYAGVYQFMVSSFAREYARDCGYINREDDAGSRGLRISKLQYHPVKIEENISAEALTELTRLGEPPYIETANLTLDLIAERDIPAYNRLCLDVYHNRYWGYDYRENISGEPPYDYFFRDAMADYENRVSLTLAVRRRGEFIGEAVINEFDLRGGANIGLRLLPEYTGRGYGKEAFAAAADFALYRLGLDSVSAYCYKENPASRRMLSSAMERAGEDDTYYYFKKTM